jgi:hypothetical protein
VLAAGLGLSVLGADWLVSGAVDIARGLGISEVMIGLTIVAMGISAPGTRHHHHRHPQGRVGHRRRQPPVIPTCAPA